jgi:hypothetical protein
MPDNTPLPDQPGTHINNTIWLDGNPEVDFHTAGDGFIGVHIKSRHGYVTIVATQEWWDALHAAMKAWAAR